ncbi:DUF1287 domain-containing protein [bacterium]|nr:DUF1287 domain-containing protein [bacterium]
MGRMLAIWICAAALATAAHAAAVGNARTSATAARIEASAIVRAARGEVARHVLYVEEYHVMKYPGGDVPSQTGVCTDLVVRAFRAVGVDLQQELHEDRVANPRAYPIKIWDNKKPDRNIDHRRCQNLAVWFSRFARRLPIEVDAGSIEKNWRAGDVVFFVHQGQTHPWHVAIVSDKKAADGVPLILHGYPPYWSETYRLDALGPIHSHWRMENKPART